MYKVQKPTLFLKYHLLIVLLVFLVLHACNTKNVDSKNEQLVDDQANVNVVSLYKRLAAISKKGFAIGHQDTTSYGLGWNYEDNLGEIRSDVNTVSGDFPAVYGFDIGHLELGNVRNLDSVSFNNMKSLMIDAHKKGGIITVSWHLDNPTSKGSSWDKTSAVSDILFGGKHREKYELWVSRVADFFNSLKVNNSVIPIIFRPFHEMNGNWFWWGEGNCTATDYITLWKETVRLLKDEHNVHNLLYVYSPNKLNPDDDYLKYYPGDAYVDILGIDIYDFKNTEDYVRSVKNDLNIVKEIAKEKKKLYAFTETGLEAITTPNWFTNVVYPNLENSGIAWVLFWRNANSKHHYMSYDGHLSSKDFVHFKRQKKTLFLKDINDLKIN